MLPFTLLAVVAALVTTASDAAAQRRAVGGPTQENAEISITAHLGKESYSSKASGSCKYEPSASIYDVPSALYMVDAQGRNGGKIKQLNLTLWRPKNGSADQVSLSLTTEAKDTRIDVNPRSPAVGTASVEVRPSSSGGTFELKGKDAKGIPLNLTVVCPSFDGVVAEGG